MVRVSPGKVRAFRHTSTLAAMKMMTALVDVALNVSINRDNTQRQYEAERSKMQNRRASDRLEVLMQRRQELEENMDEVKNMLIYIFKGIFVHRYRDSQAEIRAICMQEIGVWMRRYPAMFLDDSYLKYVGWTLYDRIGDVRLQCLRALQPLYEDPALINNLELFTSRFKSRLVDMTLDKETEVAVQALHEHATYLIDSLWDQCQMLRDWEAMLDLLLEEPGRGETAMDANEETSLIEIMVCCVRQAASGESPVGRQAGGHHSHSNTNMQTGGANAQDASGRGRGGGPAGPGSSSVSSTREARALTEERHRMTEAMITALPALLSKYGESPERATNLLAIPTYMEMELYTTGRHERHLDLLLQGVQGEEPDQDDEFHIVAALKRINAFYSCHDLSGLDLWDSLIRIAQSGNDASGDVVAQAICCCYHALLWNLKRLQESEMDKTESNKLRRQLNLYMDICIGYLDHSHKRLASESFFSICDLLVVFSRNLCDHMPNLHPPIYVADRDLELKLTNYLEQRVFIDDDDNHVERGSEGIQAVKELARRLNLSFGLDLIKIRESMVALHLEGIQFCVSRAASTAASGHPPGVPSNLLFLEVVSEFSNKLLRPDKKNISEHIRRLFPNPVGAEWSSLHAYCSSLDPDAADNTSGIDGPNHTTNITLPSNSNSLSAQSNALVPTSARIGYGSRGRGKRLRDSDSSLPASDISVNPQSTSIAVKKRRVNLPNASKNLSGNVSHVTTAEANPSRSTSPVEIPPNNLDCASQ
ncbi:unnamed protein product [Trichobilharzia regenti]|nr:unnamed protein product [Trichobilharzia regenti]